jgi:hypothetical protein
VNKKSARLERHLFVSDFQIPEHDEKAINAVLSFIPDFNPDVIHFVGDILDLTKQSRFLPDVYDKHTLNDEIQEGKRILTLFRERAEKAEFIYHFGNHENRQLQALARSQEFADLEMNGEYVLSLPHLLELKKLNIKSVNYYSDYFIHNQYVVEHGDIARSHGSYTAKVMLEKRGCSGISGHTHRLGIHYKTFMGKVKFWVETGCLCSIRFKHPYGKANDWQQGFALGIYSKERQQMFPDIVPMFDREFYWDGKFYKPYARP